MKTQVLLVALVCFFLDSVVAQIPENRLNIKLHKSVFSDSFLLIFNTNGREEMDDQDALKVGEGHLSISSLHANGVKLAIEEKAYPMNDMEIALFVKGYSTGIYNLTIMATGFKAAGIEVILFDKFLNKKILLHSNRTTDYAFTIDVNLLESQGNKRFSVLLNKVSLSLPVITEEGTLIAYPNPFRDKLFLKVKDNPTASGEVRIKDLLGRVVWRKQFKDVQRNDLLELECQELIPGLYLLEWNDQNNAKKFKTLKMIKQ